MIIGPFSPEFVADTGMAEQLANIGIMLLMFGVGLHFSLDDLIAVRKIALPGALVQITVATLLGGTLAIWWGWGLGGALVFGLACRSRARWCCCALWTAWVFSNRSPAALQCVGCWWRTLRWCSCWCCCRRYRA